MSNLMVMTYNIRHAEGNDRKVDLERTAGVIKRVNPHVVALQEVDQHWQRSGNVDQTRELARLLRMSGRFGPALVRGRSRYGNAVLSRLPLLQHRYHLLPSRRENRGMLEVYAELDCQPICLMALHLGLTQEERLNHLEYILRHITSIHLPLLLAGDFNSGPESLEIKRISRYLNDCCQVVGQSPNTFPAHNPVHRIDYVFCSHHWRVVEVKTVSSQASDHLPLIARLELPQYQS